MKKAEEPVKADVLEEPEVLEATPEPEPEQFALALYFTGSLNSLLIPTPSQTEAMALMTSIDEQRGRFVTLTIDGQSVILNPSNIAFMRVEHSPSTLLQD